VVVKALVDLGGNDHRWIRIYRKLQSDGTVTTVDRLERDRVISCGIVSVATKINAGPGTNGLRPSSIVCRINRKN